MTSPEANHPFKLIHSETLPWKSHFIRVKNSQMHYLDEGQGDPILFIHGNPTSGYLWRNIFPYLSDNARCIIPDLIGMGKSGKPRLSYRFTDHFEYMEAFIEELELEHITLVVHDWGSALGFWYAKKHPEKIKKIAFMEAILRPWHWKSLKWKYKLGFRLLRAPFTGELLIYGMNAFLRVFMPALIIRKLRSGEKKTYLKPFRNPVKRKPMLVWPREIPINRRPKTMHRIVTSYSETLCRSDTPKLLIYASPGAIINQKTVNWCKRHIRNLKTINLGKGLHFVQED